MLHNTYYIQSTIYHALYTTYYTPYTIWHILYIVWYTQCTIQYTLPKLESGNFLSAPHLNRYFYTSYIPLQLQFSIPNWDLQILNWQISSWMNVCIYIGCHIWAFVYQGVYVVHRNVLPTTDHTVHCNHMVRHTRGGVLSFMTMVRASMLNGPSSGRPVEFSPKLGTASPPEVSPSAPEQEPFRIHLPQNTHKIISCSDICILYYDLYYDIP